MSASFVIVLLPLLILILIVLIIIVLILFILLIQIVLILVVLILSTLIILLVQNVIILFISLLPSPSSIQPASSFSHSICRTVRLSPYLLPRALHHLNSQGCRFWMGWWGCATRALSHAGRARPEARVVVEGELREERNVGRRAGDGEQGD